MPLVNELIKELINEKKISDSSNEARPAQQSEYCGVRSSSGLRNGRGQ